MAKTKVEHVEYAIADENDQLIQNYAIILTSIGGDDTCNTYWTADEDHVSLTEESELKDASGDSKTGIGWHYKHCLDIFPEEIWMLITKGLDPTSLENLSNSSLCFRRLLLSQRVHFLFPKVWNILAMKYHGSNKPSELYTDDDYYDDSNEESDSYDSDEEGDDDYSDMEGDEDDLNKNADDEDLVKFPEPNKVNDSADFASGDDDDKAITSPKVSTENGTRLCPCGKVRKIRWYSEILKLRLVCKNWANIIDSFYQQLPDNFRKDNNRKEIFSETSGWTEEYFYFWDESFIARDPNHHAFLRHFEMSHGTENEDRNPFLGRRCAYDAVHYGNALALAMGNSFPDLFHILEKYGHHIWYTSISLTLATSIVELYMTLRYLLEKMPNLKELEIEYCEQTHGELGLDDISDLKLEIGLNPLPQLDNLLHLTTNNLPYPILKEIIRRNSHLSILTVLRLPTYDDASIFKLSLPTLKELYIERLKQANLELEVLETSIKKWSLETLTLDFGWPHKIDFKWPRFFTLLETKWGSTLTHAHLNLPIQTGHAQNVVLKECSSYRLNLPKVKRLVVAFENATSLDFILPMKDSLEYLKVKSYSHEIDRTGKLYQSVRKEQVIQFLGYKEQLMESNIWTLFPKLQTLILYIEQFGEVEEYRHTRREWRMELNMKLVKEKEKRRDVALQTDL